MLTIAADPKHLGARIGITAVLHTWGSSMTHHPHVHMIVPGGGISADGARWISTTPGFFLPVLVLSRLFRRLMLEQIAAAHAEEPGAGNPHARICEGEAKWPSYSTVNTVRESQSRRHSNPERVGKVLADGAPKELHLKTNQMATERWDSDRA
jgi:hypothetical protein